MPSKNLQGNKCYPMSINLADWLWPCIYLPLTIYLGFPDGSVVKNLPAVQETWVQSLGQENSLEKETGTHSSTLAWKIPWTEEPGRLKSIGSPDWVTSLSLFTFMHWRRKWQPTPVPLPGKFHGLRSPEGYSARGRKDLDTTERLHFVY